MEALTPAEQKAVRDAAAAAETRGWQLSEAADGEMQATLARHGMTVTPASPELLAGMATTGKTMVDEWLNRAGEDGKKVIDAYRAG
jgi:TRAP-type C4-dicarboxylate transport system substrate-binding protein